MVRRCQKGYTNARIQHPPLLHSQAVWAHCSRCYDGDATHDALPLVPCNATHTILSKRRNISTGGGGGVAVDGSMGPDCINGREVGMAHGIYKRGPYKYRGRGTREQKGTNYVFGVGWCKWYAFTSPIIYVYRTYRISLGPLDGPSPKPILGTGWPANCKRAYNTGIVAKAPK